MTTVTLPTPTRTPSVALRRFAWSVLAFFIATILWGAVVRATGSGAGCGEHWPLCNGTILQPSPTLHTIIELSHRVSAGAIDSILILILIVWTWRRTVAGHLARWVAGLTVFLTITEGALGAVLVEYGLTAQSRSPMRAPVEALHLSNTLLLLASLALTAHMLGRRLAFRWKDIRIRAALSSALGLLAIMAVGVTGSMAALGDTLFPATSLSNALAQDLAADSNWLLRWRWTHPTLAILATIFLIWLLIHAAKRADPFTSESVISNRKLAAIVVALLMAQSFMGAVDVWLLAPVWMQILHLLGADLLWTALVVLTARLTFLPRQASAYSSSTPVAG